MKKFKKFIAAMTLATVAVSVVGCSDTNAGQAEEQTQATTDEGTTEAAAPPDYSEYEDVIVAQVGDAQVTLAEVKKEMVYPEQMLIMQFGEDYKNNEQAMAFYKEQENAVVNYLIESKLLVQDAENFGIEVTDEEVQAEIDKVKANFESEEAFQTAMEQEGLTLETYSQFIKENLIIAKTLEKVTADIEVTDEEAKAFYDANIAQFTQPAGAELAHILVETEEEAKDIKKQYDEGKDFAELAAEYGTDGTKETGGSLGGFIAYDSPTYDADFLAGAKELGEGEVSDPVKTQFGWHLIKATNVQPEAVVKPFDEVKEQAKAGALQEKQFEAFSKHIDGLKEKSKIEIFEDKLN